MLNVDVCGSPRARAMNDDKKLTLVRELHKPARRNYTRRHVDIRGLDETWQADIVDMSSYARQNSQHKFLLTVIDIFSKFAWAIPLRSKSGRDTTIAMKSIFNQGRIPKNLHVDRGKEFYNSQFEALMKRHNVNMYSTYSNLKASICERFNRTLKNKMWMQFSLRGMYKWMDILDSLVTEYNNTVHRTIREKPKNVNRTNEREILQRIFRQRRLSAKKSQKFKIGDNVRISKFKNVFEKGYTPNWTTEIFTIRRVKRTNPTTYNLKDHRNETIAGCFYEEELQKVKYSDIYLVEKVVRKRGNRMLVKWLGFDDTHNSWIDKGDL